MVDYMGNITGSYLRNLTVVDDAKINNLNVTGNTDLTNIDLEVKSLISDTTSNLKGLVSFGDITQNTHYTFPVERGLTNQILKLDDLGNLNFMADQNGASALYSDIVTVLPDAIYSSVSGDRKLEPTTATLTPTGVLTCNKIIGDSILPLYSNNLGSSILLNNDNTININANTVNYNNSTLAGVNVLSINLIATQGTEIIFLNNVNLNHNRLTNVDYLTGGISSKIDFVANTNKISVTATDGVLINNVLQDTEGNIYGVRSHTNATPFFNIVLQQIWQAPVSLIPNSIPNTTNGSLNIILVPTGLRLIIPIGKKWIFNFNFYFEFEVQPSGNADIEVDMTYRNTTDPVGTINGFSQYRVATNGKKNKRSYLTSTGIIEFDNTAGVANMDLTIELGIVALALVNGATSVDVYSWKIGINRMLNNCIM